MTNPTTQQGLMPEPARTSDFVHLHFLVFLWGFTSILGMLMQDLDALQVVLWRGMLTLVGLVLVVTYQRNWEPIRPRRMVQMLGTGAILAVHWLTFFAAARLSNVSTCLAGLATCALWTSLLEPLITRRKFRPIELVLGFVVLIGLNMIIYADFSRTTGLLIGVFSAVCSALFSVLNVGFVRQYKAITITFYEILGCTLTIACMIPVFNWIWPNDFGLWAWPNGSTFGYLLVLAWLCTVYAYTASVSLMKRFTVFAMNLTINLEPVYGIILAWLFFGQTEEMTLGFYAGTVLIIASVVAYPSLSKRFMG